MNCTLFLICHLYVNTTHPQDAKFVDTYSSLFACQHEFGVYRQILDTYYTQQRTDYETRVRFDDSGLALTIYYDSPSDQCTLAYGENHGSDVYRLDFGMGVFDDYAIEIGPTHMCYDASMDTDHTRRMLIGIQSMAVVFFLSLAGLIIRHRKKKQTIEEEP